MNDHLPADRQEVEVRFDDRDWLAAVYRNGEFVDAYGFTLDRNRISGWRPLALSAGENRTH